MDMYEIKIPIMDIPFENFKGYCENFGCILHKPKKGEVDWIITSDDPTKFSIITKENIKLIGVLREMSKDIDTVTDIDFNDALKVLVNK